LITGGGWVLSMAPMFYIFVTFYSMGWGPVPWIYVADIFPTRTRHYGLALANSSQWLSSEFFLFFSSLGKIQCTYY